MVVNPDFTPKRARDKRLPPGQYEVKDFPVLSLGPTPKIDKNDWSLQIRGLADGKVWNWEEFNKLPMTDFIVDIHCVTKWSKLGSVWRGVSFDEIFKLVHPKPEAKYVIAYSYDGYSTNIPVKDLTHGQAIIAVSYDGKDIPPEHGGPVRIVLPHLYFWKSAKWLKEIEFVEKDSPGFWEQRGYHIYGDPWKEQRYSFDE